MYNLWSPNISFKKNRKQNLRLQVLGRHDVSTTTTAQYSSELAEAQ